MSVNITVNGKFAKHCRSHPLLNDPLEVRKAEEKERRKLRLLQVREESKKLAKKIRDEVNEEKKRELQKLQAIKEKELECWRQHVLQRKGEEYREAIFEIGTAHQAAKRENEEKAAKQKNQGSYKDFKRQMAARKSQAGKVQFSCNCQQIKTSANKQYKCSCTQTNGVSKSYQEGESCKRKRDLSFSSNESECEDEGFKEQTTLPQNSISITSSSSSLSFDSSLVSISNNVNNKTTQTSVFEPCSTNKCLIKTPAVYVDVEVGSEDSITISAPCEVKDKHVEYNRQFNSVIRVSPRKGGKHAENTCGNTALQQTSSTTTTLSSESTAIPISDSKSSSKHQQVTKEKRFTIISDLVKKQQDNTNIPKTTYQSNNVTNSQATSVTVTPHLSPRKQATARPSLFRTQPVSPRKTSATSKSSRVVTDNTQPSTTFTATTKSNTAIPSACSSSGRVQFYDYNSKMTKEREQSTTAVSVQRQRDLDQPTAMEQAELEREKEREKQMEALKKCQQMEERGQKALEREQVRRDCHELTEKLEALIREYPNQVPTNDNHPHLFDDKQLRKEGKMNSAVEKLLNRPTIITCSQIKQPVQEENKPSTAAKNNLENAINVANLNNEPFSLDDVSTSDSCCSILLGYVDDQSRLVKQDLQNNSTQNQTKQKRLKTLLRRLDDLRCSLIQELKNDRESKSHKMENEKTKFSCKEENFKQVIDSISEMRKEREDILIDDKPSKDKPLREREKELQAKEAILEQKVREFYEIQKEQNKTTKSKSKHLFKSSSKEDSTEDSSSNKTKTEESKDKENKIFVKGENPLEIIITVKGEAKSVKIPQKSKKRFQNKKSPNKLATLIKSPQAKRQTPKKKIASGLGVLKRQNSYDSNSTSYMSLPAEIPNKINDLAQQITQEKQQTTKENKKFFKQNEADTEITSTQNLQQVSETSLEPLGDTLTSQPPPRINPLIAQYVQRLLGMSRQAVEKLGVSSSEIDTPGSSVINTTENMLHSDTLISEKHLMSIHNFIEENRSFIKELEQSIRSQNNETLENSMRKFDDIWQKRLKTENDKMQNKPKTQTIKNAKSKQVKEDNLSQKTSTITVEQKTSKKSKEQQSSTASKTIERKLSSNDLHKDLGKTLSSHYSSDDRESLKSLKNLRKPIEKVNNTKETKHSTDSSSKAESDSQIARYAKLTENCTHRIAELTELINRVRQEKQRLLEVTLSSVSDNGRQSTEYLELPEGKSSTRNEPDDATRVSSSSEETATQAKHTQSSDTLREMPPKLSSQDKNKQITASRDSGLADSRPVTAQEHRNDPEPISQTSSDSLMMPPPPSGRKLKPPPTLKRFSPQLPEDELAHELSTILEVDTPATSRINTAAGQSTEDRENLIDNSEPQKPIKFPTFEQYIKQLDLDVTQLDPEQSIQLQQEFTTFLEYLQQQRSPEDNSPKYSEFPSINAYIHRLAEDDQLGDILEESLAQLRISSIPSRNFPAAREYMKNNASKSTPEDQQLLDTESLENITEEPTPTSNNTENDTASLDIEAELKRRKILKNSFRFSETKKQQIFSSTAHRDAAFYQDIIAIESGVDKLSSSGNTTELLEQDLGRMVEQWPGKVQKKSKEIKILSSTTTSANASDIANSALRAASLDDSSRGTGQAFNLREFFTRELLKHAIMSGSVGSSSCSDDSLRSNFLHSLIGSLTPRTPGAASKSGALTLDRQKTSTPVPVHSTQTHSSTSSQSNTSSQLFSGESRLSSVHYQDRSVRFFTSDGGANADHSSE